MKNLLLLALVALATFSFAQQPSQSQQATQAEKEQNRFEQMFDTPGKLIKKEFLDVGLVRQGLAVQTYSISYPLEGSKIERGIRIVQKSFGSVVASSALIDEKDLDGCILALKLIGSELYTYTGGGYKEFVYTTSDGFKIGGSKDGEDFIAFMDIDNYRFLTTKQYFNIQEISKIKQFFEQGRDALKK